MMPLMKGIWYSRLVGKELSLLLIALVCATILLWSLERSPLVTPFTQPKDELQLSTDQGIEQKIFQKINNHITQTPVNNSTESDIKRPNKEGKEECDFAKGKWVIDDRYPLYSGFGCKQWLSQMWACRMMQRQDFSYERLRWKPKNCEMEHFEGPKVLEKMRDKLIAIVGDSLGRQQFQSLMCMLTAGEERPDVVDVGRDYGLVKAKGAIRPDGWAYRFPATNTTVLYYWSACLCDLEPVNATDPQTLIAMHLDRPPKFLQRYLPSMDVLVLNTGHHWNRGKITGNRWVMHVGGREKAVAIGEAKNLTVRSIVAWVDGQLAGHERLRAFYRSLSPRHFVNGEWNTGGSCDNEKPSSVGKEVEFEESGDVEAAGALRDTAVRLLDVTALSQVRDEGHISRYSLSASPGVQDCLHWCLPGVPDTWNHILFAQL